MGHGNVDNTTKLLQHQTKYNNIFSQCKCSIMAINECANIVKEVGSVSHLIKLGGEYQVHTFLCVCVQMHAEMFNKVSNEVRGEKYVM